MTDADSLPSAGAVYSGDGRLILGEGPPFSLSLVADLAFQAVLHDQAAPGNSMEDGDRMWVLPDQPWAVVAVPERLLVELAGTIRTGNKVLIMAYESDAGNLACEAVERMLDTPHGAA